jgi:anti-sigma factor RsiW
MASDPADPACEQIEPLLAAYALGEQDTTLVREVVAHLSSCPRCSDALAAYQQVARLLPLSTADAPPSVGLRERVIAAVDAAAHDAPGQFPPAPPRRPLARRWPLAGWPGRSLVAALLVALIGWNLALQQQVAALEGERDLQRSAVVTLLGDGPLVRHHLTAGSGAPQATATLVLVPEQANAALMVSGLPPLPANRVYQLWLVAKGARISGGTFTVDSAGKGMLLLRAPLPMTSYDTAGVTVEPRGGSPGPTSPRVIGGPLS